MKLLAFGYFLIQLSNGGKEESLQKIRSCSSMAPLVPVSHRHIPDSGIIYQLIHGPLFREVHSSKKNYSLSKTETIFWVLQTELLGLFLFQA